MDIKSFYHIYNAEQLVFIVGSEVLRMKDMPRQPVKNNGALPTNKTFEETAIETITGVPYANGPKTFSSIAIDLPNKNISSNRLIGIYRSFQKPEFDSSLIDIIANLSKANVIIQTSFDPLLKQALGNNLDTYVWNNKSEKQVYLDLTNKKRKLLYLFGDTFKGISLFEEEQVDCLLNLSTSNEKGKSTSPSRH